MTTANWLFLQQRISQFYNLFIHVHVPPSLLSLIKAHATRLFVTVPCSDIFLPQNSQFTKTQTTAKFMTKANFQGQNLRSFLISCDYQGEDNRSWYLIFRYINMSKSRVHYRFKVCRWFVETRNKQIPEVKVIFSNVISKRFKELSTPHCMHFWWCYP